MRAGRERFIRDEMDLLEVEEMEGVMTPVMRMQIEIKNSLRRELYWRHRKAYSKKNEA